MKNLPIFALLLFSLVSTAQEKRNLVTDEPRTPKGKPEGAADYVVKVAPTDGQHLALTMQKLENGITPARPFLIWAIGSSYTNMLGSGEMWQQEIPKRFPKAPPNSTSLDMKEGFARERLVR